MKLFKYNTKKPPRLLSGFLSLVILIVASLYVASWQILEYQLSKFVKQRTQEYAHSITHVIAQSSADAILSEDKLQLNNLVNSVANVPYVISATLFKDDGRILDEYKSNPPKTETKQGIESLPKVEDISSNSSMTKPITDKETDKKVNEKAQEKTEQDTEQKKTQDKAQVPVETNENQRAETLDAIKASSLTTERHRVFVEPIEYQGVTAGWFKLVLDAKRLESIELKHFQIIKRILLTLVAISVFLLIFVLFRYASRLKMLSRYAHRFIENNSQTLPTSQESWLNTLGHLSLMKVESEKQEEPEPEPEPENTKTLSNKN